MPIGDYSWPIPARFSRIEMREQPEHLVIIVETAEPPDDGMLALVDYLSGANSEGRPIALNGPLKRVLGDRLPPPFLRSSGQPASGPASMSFAVSGHLGQTRLPEPKNSRIQLSAMPACRRLTLRFLGSPTPARIAHHSARLKDFMVLRRLLPHGTADEPAALSVIRCGFFCISGLSVMVAPWPQAARSRVAGSVLQRSGVRHPAHATMTL